LFTIAFSVIAGRMVDVTVIRGGSGTHRVGNQAAEPLESRADIVDRNGVLLATSLPTMSLSAHPKEIRDKASAAQRLHQVLPEVAQADLQLALNRDRPFVFLRRNLTPHQEYDINALGIPGLYFERSEKRIYPQGALTAHVVGLTDLDNKGVAGVEKFFERSLATRQEPLRLSIDIRVQTILHDELTRTMEDFRALGAMGMVMDVQTGELLAMASLPDFDPNYLPTATPGMFNRATLGVYEMGSTFKLFNTAAALDDGVATLTSTFDATHPLDIAGYTIHDDEPQNRWLTVPEILVYSSNIGSARIATELGTERQRDFLGRLGLLRRTGLELPELGTPLVPNPWREINTLTISFGHGMAVTPLHMMTAVSALVNGGVLHPATLLRQDEGAPVPGERVIKPQTSQAIRQLMRLVVTAGTGKTAEVAGYEVGGKTGTAEKSGGGGYQHKKNLSSFIAAFPINNPRYLVLVMVDEPHGTKESGGFTTAHWNAAPAVGRIIAQIGPLLGVAPLTSSADDRLAQDTPPPDMLRGDALSKEITFAEAQ
jgi:cell division protein FtsI (penicillin-binding protein 3)